jgi:diguanylate cyclase (GGDEF)-like protein
MKSNSSRFPYLSLALLSAWLVAGTAGIYWTDHALETPYLAIALLLFTAVLAVANLFRFSALLAVIVAAGVYNAVMLTLRPVDVSLVIPLAVGNLVILGAGLLGWISARHITRLNLQQEHDNRVIHDLRVKDPDLGIVRMTYAMQTLKTEVFRSQRYNSSLCLILIQIADMEAIDSEKGAASLHEIRRQVSGVLADLVREMDLLFGKEYFGIILPETGGEGAMIVAHRMTDMVARKVRVGLHIGIAEFGVDAFSDAELYRAAETAMLLAKNTDRPIVTYSQVRSITDQPQPEAN